MPVTCIYMNIQPFLEDDMVRLIPLQEEDFETLYQAASDPMIWEQHPNRDRWQLEVFSVFFEGAMQSGGAFRIIDKSTGETAGCTRYYDADPEQNSIMIGYTFLSRAYWGTGLNTRVKKMMLEYIFRYVSRVFFHIGADNKRSQLAISRLGAIKTSEQEVAYFGEPSRLNFVYLIEKNNNISTHS